MCAKQNTVKDRQGRGLKGSVTLAGPVMPEKQTLSEQLTKICEATPSKGEKSLQLLSSISNNSAESTITSQTKEKVHQAIQLIASKTT